ncbi:MAG: hypothetical protein ABIP20_19835 [Chthoniobacteraceae bacterium]
MNAASQISLLPILLLAFAVASCSWTGKDGTRHSLVIGIGVLSTKEQMQGAALITKTSLLGVALQGNPAMRGLIVGYSERLLAQIPPRWEGQLSLASSPRKPLTVQASACNSGGRH